MLVEGLCPNKETKKHDKKETLHRPSLEAESKNKNLIQMFHANLGTVVTLVTGTSHPT